MSTANFRHRETLTLLFLLTSLPPLVIPAVNAAADPNSDYPNPVRASPFIGIIFLLFTALIIFAAILYYYLRERCLRRRSSLLLRLAAASAHRVPDLEGGGRGGLNPALVKSFPELTYSEAKMKYVNAGPDCAVCLSAFEDHETLRLLPKCCHVFHPDCVGIWLASHSTCPCCRADLLKESPSNDVVVDVQTPEGTART